MVVALLACSVDKGWFILILVAAVYNQNENCVSTQPFDLDPNAILLKYVFCLNLTIFCHCYLKTRVIKWNFSKFQSKILKVFKGKKQLASVLLPNLL